MFSPPLTTARAFAELHKIQQLEHSHELYRMDNRHYPTIYEELTYYTQKMNLWNEDSSRNQTFALVVQMVRQQYDRNQKQGSDDWFAVSPLTIDSEKYQTAPTWHCLPNHTYDWLLRVSLEAEQRLFPDYYIQRGEDEIRRDFEKMKHLYCYVNATAVLMSKSNRKCREFFEMLR